MPPMSTAPDTPALPRSAASLVLLRDAPQGLQVLLLRRHGQASVLGGAHVFPGGKVDAGDTALPIAAFDKPRTALHARLGEPGLDLAAAAGLYAAAVRETFEECGVLLVHGVQAAAPAEAAALLRDGVPFADILARLNLRLATRDVAPWSRWITPVVPMTSMAGNRFDTRFFVATLPPGQTALHDGHENTDSVWLTPRDALQQYWDGAISLAPPQIMGLSVLCRHADAAGVLQAARATRPPVIQPERIDIAGERGVCYPGDPCHPVAQRALPGPTRLVQRNNRFEPLEGLDALLFSARS